MNTFPHSGRLTLPLRKRSFQEATGERANRREQTAPARSTAEKAVLGRKRRRSSGPVRPGHPRAVWGEARSRRCAPSRCRATVSSLSRRLVPLACRPPSCKRPGLVPGRATDPRKEGTGMAQEDGEVLLEVRNLTLAFGGVQALRGVSLEVLKNEIFSIIGPN